MGSFHKAADILGITPSAISHAISNMESELGFPVLTRSKSGISLTNYGEHLLPYVNAVLNSEESLQQNIAEMNGLKTGRVKIGVFSSVCTNWLPEILSSFQSKYEGIESKCIRALMMMWQNGLKREWLTWDFYQFQVQKIFQLSHFIRIHLCACFLREPKRKAQKQV